MKNFFILFLRKEILDEFRTFEIIFRKNILKSNVYDIVPNSSEYYRRDKLRTNINSKGYALKDSWDLLKRNPRQCS